MNLVLIVFVLTLLIVVNEVVMEPIEVVEFVLPVCLDVVLGVVVVDILAISQSVKIEKLLIIGIESQSKFSHCFLILRVFRALNFRYVSGLYLLNLHSCQSK